MEKVYSYKIDKSEGDKLVSLFKKVLLGIFIFIVVVVTLFGSFYTVPAGARGVLLTFGEADLQEKMPGIHVKIPLAQSVVLMSVQTEKYEADAGAASKDLQVVRTKIAVNYHISEGNIVNLYKNIGLNYGDKVIQPTVQEVVKASTAKYTAEELITKRELVKESIESSLKERLLQSSINVDATSITNFDFSAEFNNGIELKVVAQQSALKAVNDLQRIEVEKNQTITQAEGQAAAIRLKADADSYALKVVREQLEANDKLIQYQAIQKWDGKMPYVNGGGALPFIQLNNSN
jgi:regulator of protease activity HflC (stomatin/prohibitin superfamily)